MKPEKMAKIQRALGMIEGLASGLDGATFDLLYGAIEDIDEALKSEQEEGASDALIHRQKAEIEKLGKLYKLAVAEREVNAKEFTEQLHTIKAEAIKEFAEKVKMEFYTHFDELIPSIMADKIDSLVEEMVGAK